MMRTSVMFGVLAVVGLAACAGDDGGSSSNLTSTEQVNNSCPSQPVILDGTVASGGACVVAEDCAPSCCTCPGGTGEAYLGANCLDGTCAGSSTACANTADACD